MSNYYKGGTYVPNIISHSNVPISGLISLSNFYGVSKTVAASSPQLPTNYKYALLTSAFSGQANASAVPTWGAYRQTNTTYQPKYYTSGGYNNRPFVRFTSAIPTQLLNSVQTTYRFDLGFTLMFLMKHTEAGNINKNDFARWSSIHFSGGGYTEFCRNSTTNDMQFFVYYKTTSGTFSWVGVNTSGGTAIVKDRWTLYACRFRNDTRIIEIKMIPLSTVKTSVSSISEFTTLATTTNTPSLITSTTTVANYDAVCSYTNTGGQVPAHDFGGGFIFDHAVTDAELVIAANYLVADPLLITIVFQNFLPTRARIARKLQAYNNIDEGGGGNTWRDWDYDALLARYGLSNAFYIIIPSTSTLVKVIFNSPENPYIKNTNFSYATNSNATSDADAAWMNFSSATQSLFPIGVPLSVFELY
jgi:hypothetical protein